jgi:hypothetical protein
MFGEKRKTVNKIDIVNLIYKLIKNGNNSQ